MTVNKRPVDMLSVSLTKVEVDRMLIAEARERLANEKVDPEWPPVVQQVGGSFTVFFKASAK